MRSKGRTIRIVSTPENQRSLDRNCIASAGPRPCVSGMRKQFWGNKALIVMCGQYAYLMSHVDPFCN